MPKIRAPVVTVTSEKGGSGKTTVSLCLAVVASVLEKQRVLLLDADPRRISVAWRAAAVEAESISPDRLPDVEGIQTAISRTVARRRTRYDLIVIDTAPADCARGPLDRIVAESIAAANLVVVPVIPGLDVWGLASVAQRVAKRSALYVMNKYNPRYNAHQAARRALVDGGLRVAETTLAARAIYGSSLVAGSAPVIGESRRPSHENARAEIINLFNEVEETLWTGGKDGQAKAS